MAQVQPPHQRKNKGNVEHHVRHHGDDANAHRRAHVFSRIEAWGQRLHQHKGTQTQRVGAQTRRRHGAIITTEGAVLKKRCQEWLGQYGECRRRRNGDQQHAANRPAERTGEGGVVGAGALTR